MSTNDVPGYKSANRDTLSMGCWAEKSDGSYIFVMQNENGTVYYKMYDTQTADGLMVEYTDAMPEQEFKTLYSFDSDKSTLSTRTAGVPNERWTWHDKTPFPFPKVIRRGARDGVKYASADDLLTAASRVAASLNLRGSVVDMSDGKTRTGLGGFLRSLAEALDKLETNKTN